MSKPNQNLEDFTVDGNCTRCGACCSNFLPLSTKEIKMLKRWVKKHHFKPETAGRLRVSALDVDDFLNANCPFLIQEGDITSCAVYKSRPEICKEFTCRRAIQGDIPNHISRDKQVVNLRQVVFEEEGAMSIGEYMLLLAYIENRPKEAKDDE